MNIIRILFNLFRFDRANWKAVALCVFAAIVFWIFNALNKDYSTNVRFPILFEFDGEKYAAAEHLPKTVNLNVSGKGWELFWKHLGVKVPPAIIPLEHPTDVKKIVGSTLAPILATQIGNLKINYVVTDTLKLQIDERDSHRYKLAADVSAITFRNGYGRISPVVVLPDSVKLDGPQSVLHALGDSVLLVLDGKKISDNFRQDVEVTFPGNEFVKRDPPIAQVIFEVGEVIEVVKWVKVAVEKNGKDEVMDSVEARFRIPKNREEDFKSTTHPLFSQISFSRLKGNRKVAPKVSNVPNYAQLLSVDSVYSNTK